MEADTLSLAFRITLKTKTPTEDGIKIANRLIYDAVRSLVDEAEKIGFEATLSTVGKHVIY